MNKICPLMLIGRNSDDVTLVPGVGVGTYACIGKICAAIRRDESGAWYCGLAGPRNCEDNIFVEDLDT